MNTCLTNTRERISQKSDRASLRLLKPRGGRFSPRGLALGLLVLTAGAGWGQSRIPANASDYLESGYAASGTNADHDHTNVAFFEVPDTVSSSVPLYFAVYHTPNLTDTTDPDRYTAGDITNPKVTYYLYGGSGCISGSGATNYDYTEQGGTPFAGMSLDSFFDTNSGSTTRTWTYFSPVYLSQGEHIGTKYYFKIIAQASISTGTSGSFSHGYQFNASYSDSGDPSGIANVRSFMYSWTMFSRASATFNIYPFVPTDATGNIVFHNFYYGNTETLSATDLSSTSHSINCSNTEPWLGISTSFAVSGQTGGCWSYKDVNNGSSSDGLTWFTDSSGTAYRGYASPFTLQAPHHTVISPANAMVLTSTGSQTFTLQIVDSSGNPVEYAKKVWVDIGSSSAKITYSGSTGDSGAGVLVTTDSYGLATFSLADAIAEVVSVQLKTDGSANGSSTLPGAASNGSATVTFMDDPKPSISSASNTTFKENAGSPQSLPSISITDSGTSNITSADELRVIIPSGLGAIFSNSVTSVTAAGSNTGSYAVTYDDNRTAVIAIPGSFAVGTTTFAGLNLTYPSGSAYAVSSGSLGISWNGSSAVQATDDKVIAILSQYATFVWTGGTDNAWGIAGNWSGNVAPSASTDNIVIPGGCSRYPATSASVNINSLIIDSGASLTVSGGAFTVSGSITNSGTITIGSGGSISKNDATNGGMVVLANSLGGTVESLATASYYNLTIASGSYTSSSAISVAHNYSQSGGSLSLGNTLAVTGSLGINGGTFIQGYATSAATLNLGSGNAVTFTNSAALTVSGTARINTGSSGNVTLTNTGNSFGNDVVVTSCGSLGIYDSTDLGISGTASSLRLVEASTVSGKAVSIVNSGAVVIAGPVTAGTGSVTISTGSSGGTITQDTGGLITADAINLQTGSGSTGAIGASGAPMRTAAPDTATLTLGVSSGLLGAYVSHTGALSLAAPSLATNAPLSVIASGLLTLPAAAINTGSGELILTSGVTLTSLAALSSSTSVALAASGGTLSLGYSVTGATMTLTAAGAITQTGGTFSGTTLGATTLNDSGAAITLNKATNAFTNVSLRALNAAGTTTEPGAITYVNATGFDVASAGIRSTALVSLTAGGAVTETGTISAGGLVLRGAGAYTLGTANSAGTIAAVLSGGSLSYTDSAALTVGSLIDATGTVDGISLSANGSTLTLSAGSNTITLNKGLSTGAGTIAVESPVALGADIAIDTTNGGTSAVGGAIGLTSIAGGGKALTLNGGTGGAVTISAAADNISTLTVTDSNGVIFQGSYGLGTAGAVTIASTQQAGATITFQGTTHLTTLATEATAAAYNLSFTGTGTTTVDSAATLTNTGTLTLGSSAGGTFTFTNGLAATTPAVSLGGNLNSVNKAISLGALSLLAASKVDTSNAVASAVGASISIVSIPAGGACNLALVSRNGTAGVMGAIVNLGILTLQDGDTQSTGTVTLNGSAALAGLTTYAQGYKVELLGAANSVGSASVTSLLNTGGVTIGSTGTDSTTFTGGLSSISAGANTFQGTVKTGGTTGENIALSNLAIGSGGLSLDGGMAGAITVSGTTTGTGYSLTIAYSASATFSGAVGASGSALGTVAITNTVGTVAFDGGLYAATLATAAQGYGLSIGAGSGSQTSVIGSLSGPTVGTFNNTGILTLGDATGGDSATFTNGVLAAPSVSTILVGGSVATGSSANLNLGKPVTLLAATNFTAGTSANPGALTLGGTVDGAFPLTVNACSASSATGGAVSGITGFTLASGNTFTLGGNLTVSGGISINLGSNLDVSSSGNYAVSLAGDWVNAGTFTARSGTVTFNGTASAQTITPASSPFYDLAINNASSSAPQVNGLAAFNVGHNLTLTKGTLRLFNGTTTIGGNVTGAGTLDASAIASGSMLTITGTVGENATVGLGALVAPTGTLQVAGGIWNVTALTNSGGTVAFTGASTQTVYPNGQIFNAVSLTGTGPVRWSGIATVSTLDIGSDSTFSLDSTVENAAAVLNVASGGGITNSHIFSLDSSKGTLTLEGLFSTFKATYSGNDITWGGNNLTVGNLIYGPAASLPSGTTLMQNGNATFTAGITGASGSAVAVGAYTLTLGANSSFAGALTIDGATGNVAAGTKSVTTSGMLTFGTANGGSIVCGDFTASGTVTNSYTSAIAASGNVSVSAATFSIPANSTILMSGSGKTVDTATQIGNLSVTSGASVTVSGDKLNLNGNLSVAGVTASASFTDSTSSKGMAIGGSVTITTTGLYTGTVTSGSAACSVAGTTSGTGSWVGGSGALTFTGIFSLASITESSTTTTFTGSTVNFTNFMKTATGSVQLNRSGNQTLTTADQHFNNLSLVYNSNPKTVTVNGALNVDGALEIGQSQTLNLATNNVAATVTGTTNATAGTTYGTINLGSSSIFTGAFQINTLVAYPASAIAFNGISVAIGSGGFACNTSTATFGYAGTTTLTSSGAWYAVTVADKTTVQPQNGTTVNRNFTLASATTGSSWFSNGQTLTFASATAGTITDSNSTLVNLGTVVVTGTGKSAGSNLSMTTLSMSGGALTVGSSYTLNVSSSTSVTGGVLTLTGAYAGGSASFAVGSSAGTVSVGTASFVAGVMTVSSGGTFTQTGDNGASYTQSATNLTVSGTGKCAWDAGVIGGTLSVTTNIDSSGITTGGSLAFNKKNVKVYGTITGPIEFYDLVIPANEALTPGASTTITVRHDMTIEYGGSYVTTNSPTLVLGGSNSVSGGSYTDYNGTAVNLGTVQVTGNHPKTINTNTVAAMAAGNLTVTSPAALLSNGKNLTLTGSLAGSGTVRTSSGSEIVAVGGDISVTTLDNGTNTSQASILVAGSMSIPVTGFTAGHSTVTFDGSAGVTCLGYDFYNLTVAKTASAATVTPLGAVTVQGTLTLTEGTWIAGSNTLELKIGNWDSSSGTFIFTAGTGSVQLDAATPMVVQKSGDSFYDLILQQGGVLTNGSYPILTVANNLIAANAVTGGALSISGSGTVNVGNTLNLKPGTTGATLTANSSTLILTGLGSQTVITNAQHWNNLTIDSRLSGTVTFSGALNVTGTWTVGGSGAYGVTISNGGTATNAVIFNNTGALTIASGYTFTAGATAKLGQKNIAGTILAGGSSDIDFSSTPVTTTAYTTLGGTTGTISLGATTIASSSTLTLGDGTNASIFSVASATGLPASGNIAIANTTADVTFAGAVSENIGTVGITKSGGTVSFAGNLVAATLTPTVGAYNVSIIGSSNAITNAVGFNNTGILTLGDGGDFLTFSGGVTATAPSSVSVNGTVGGTGAITLGDNDTLLLVAGNSTIGSAAGTGAISLASGGTTTIANGSLLIIGAGGSTSVTTGSLATGGTASSATINTAGTADVTGSMNLGTGTLTVTNSAGTTFASTVTVGTITLSATTGTIAFQGMVTATTLNTAIASYAVSMTGSGSSVANAVTFSNSGGVAIGDANADTFTFTGGITAMSGTNTFQGSIATGGSAGENISLSNLTVGGTGGTLSLDTGASGTIATTAVVSGSGKHLTIANADGATFGGAVTLGTLTLGSGIAAGNPLVFNGAVTIGTLDPQAGIYDLAFDTGGTVTNTVIFNNTGALTVGNDAADSFTFTAGATKASGALNFAGSITSTATDQNWTTTGAITITANPTTFSSTSGNISFGGPVDASVAATDALAFDSTGTVTFAKAVGTTKNLLSIASNAGGTTVFNGGSVKTSGAQSYGDAVTLGADTTFTGVGVDFASTLNSDATAHTLIVNDSGVTTFGGIVGGTHPLASITTDSAGTTAINGGAVTTSGTQIYNDMVMLGANTAFTGAGVDFASTLNSDATARTLTVNDSGTTTFGGIVGGTHPLSSIATDSAGSTAINTTAVMTSGAQTYNDAVTLGADTTLADSGTTFSSTLDGTHALTIAAGAGNITFTGSVGLVNPLAILSVTSVGSGAASVLIDADLRSIGGQTYNGLVTIADAGSIGSVVFASSSTLGILTFNGAVTHTSGTIRAGALAAGTVAIKFASDYTAASAATLEGSSTTDPDIEFSGNVVLGHFTHNYDRLVFDGSTAQSFVTNGQTVYNLTLNNSGSTTAAKTLTLASGNNLAFATGGALTLTEGILEANGNMVTLGADLSIDNTSIPTLMLSNGTLSGGSYNITVGQGILDASGTASVTTTGIFKQNASSSVTVGTGKFATGDMTVSGGTFTQYGVNTGADTVASLTVSGTGSCTWDSPAMGGTLTISGDVSNAGTLLFNDKQVTIGGKVTGNITFMDLIIPNGKTVTPQSGATLTVLRHFTINDGGKYVHNGQTLTLGGTAIAGIVTGDITDNNTGSHSLQNLGVVKLVAGSTGATTKTLKSAIAAKSVDVGPDVTLLTSGKNLSLTGSLTGSGIVTASGIETITVGGSMSVATFNAGSSTVTFDGSSAATCLGYTFYNLVMDMGAVGATLTPSAGITVTNGFTQTMGTFVADGPASGLLHKIAGEWDSYSSGSGADVGFIPGNSTIELTSTTPPVNSALSFYNLTLDAGGALSRSATVTNSFVAGASAGTLTLGSYTLTVGGALTLDSNCTLVATGSTVVLNGSAGQTVTTNAQDFNNLTIDTRPSGTVTFSGALNVNGTWTVGGSGAYNVTVLNGGTAANAVTFNNTGVLTINTASTESFTFTGGVTATSPSGIQTAGTIATTNTAMTLGGTLQTLTLDVGTTLTSGSGIIHVEGPVTDGSSSYTLTLGNASQTGAITIDGALTVNGLATANSSYALNLNQLAGGQTSVIDTAVIFNNTGALVIGNDAADSFTFTAGAAKEAGPASFAGTIASTNNVQNWTTTGAITITADTTFTTGTASLAFGGLIDADTSGSHALVLTSAGAITLGKAIGSTKSLFSLASTAAGTIAINGSSITTASAQSYVGPVTLGVDTVLAAGGSGKAISFGSTIDGGNSLALDSGSTGAITVTGNVGGITPLATVTITNSNGATFDGSIVANSFIIANTASSATVLAKGAMTLATGMTVTGTSNAYNVSLTGGAVIAGATTFANTGALILGDEATDTFTFTEGLVATAPTLDSFQGTVSTDLAAGYDISLKNLAVGSGGLTLNASGALDNVLLSGSVTVKDGDLTVYAVSLNTASVAAADRGTLTVSPADSPTGNRTATFNVTGLYLSGLTTTISGSYLGVADLTSAAFTVGTLSNAGTLRLTGTQATHACSSYSVAEGTVEYYDGSSAGTVFTSGMSDGTQNYYNLLIVGPTQTFTLENDIVLKNNLSITGGYLDVGSSNHAISLGGDWSNPLETAAWNATTEAWDFGTPRFGARAGTVTFTKSSGVITVSGSNQWCGFICTKAGVTIRFENGKVQRIIAGGIFQVQGTSSSYINLNRVTTVSTPLTPPVTLTDDSEFWFFDLIPGATLDMKYAYVWYSNARSFPVSVPDSVKATPYGTYYSYKWLFNLFTMYSYMEDSDYNGKIDRIRVTTEAAVGNDFSGFTAVVDGYDVTGYLRPSEGNTFYILLKEKGYTDTGATPNWHISTNTTLKDRATNTKPVSTLSRHGGSDWMTPGNTAWPRVGHTLMIPGSGQVFIQFSEPVVTSAGSIPAATDFDSAGSTLVAVTSSGSGIKEATWTTTARSVASIASGSDLFTLSSTLRGMGSAPYWEEAYESLVIGAPYPTYPPASGYVIGSEGDPTVYKYAADRSDDAMRAVNPFNLYRGGNGNTTHRVSDLLISAPPSSTAAADYPPYFVWPVWAKDSRTLTLSEDQIEALVGTSSASTGIGLIRAFDGSQWLRDQDLTLVARANPSLSASALRLCFDAGVADSYLATSNNGPTGLWLPAFSESSFSGIVPIPNSLTTKAEGSAGQNSLWTLSIDADNAKIKSGAEVQFFFALGPESMTNPLYCARLDMAAGAAVPANWYRLIKPFAFQIHDVRSQKGSVTILNNVIDPTKGETVRLSYQVPSTGAVTVTVFTLDGDVVKRLYSGTESAGDYSTSWDGKNLNGASVARGIYFVRVVGPGLDELRKVLVVRK